MSYKIAYTGLDGRRRTVLCRDYQVNEYVPEKKICRERTGVRRKYLWGKTGFLASIEVGEARIVRYIDKDNYGNWRTMASRAWRDYGARYTIRSRPLLDEIEIKRLI